ncbi:MAG TPA: antibiotic biosynthesis monooxygenase [Myxococcota bacterium]|jgi:quinol monooxygenase YgiN
MSNNANNTSDTSTANRKRLGILALLEAKPGKERALADLLQGARALAIAEGQTTTWYAVQAGPASFAIFDTFADDAGRDAHLNGQIASALLSRADELLSKAPDIKKVDVLAAK